MAASRTTTNHDEIRRWVEKNGGCPARAKATGRSGEDPGILRIDYPGYSGKTTLAPMDWDEWFEAFDENRLAFVYQPSTRFSKLVVRSGAARSGARKIATAGRRGVKAKSRGTKKVAARAPKRTTARRATKRPTGVRTKASANSKVTRAPKRTTRKASKRATKPRSRRTSSRQTA